MRKLLAFALLFAASAAYAGSMDLFVDLNPANGGFKSLMSYAWTTGMFEFDPSAFDVYQEISPGVASYGAAVTYLSFSHNLTGAAEIFPPVCFQAATDVTVHYAVSGTATYSKTSSQLCYQGPPPPPPPTAGPVSGPDGPCDGGNCGDSFGTWEPLVLDLNGDGVNTTGRDEMVWFDLNGDGVKDHMTWTNGGTMEGFLWVDLTGKRNRVDNGSELFGVGTVLPDGTKARDGFEALAMYDDPGRGGNGDGVIDAHDEVWNKLRLWVDANHDGVCQSTEVDPIHKFGIEGISLAAVKSTYVDSHGNGHYLRGRYWRHVQGHLQFFDIDGLTFQGDRR